MSKVKADLLWYYIYSICHNLDFARGIFVLFLLQRGFSNAEIGVLQTVLFWSNLGAEIPAGILADRYKRKYSVAAGLVGIGLAAIGYLIFDSYLAFLVIFILHGFGFAFQSGADTALLFDNLKARGEEWGGKYLSISARTRNLGTFAMAAAILSGGYLSQMSWKVVYGSFAVAMFLGALAILKFTELRPKNGTAEEEEQKPRVIDSLKFFLKDRQGKLILLFILSMGFLEAMHAPFFIFIQTLLKDYGLSASHIGFVVAGSLLLTSFSYLLIERLPRWQLKNIIKWSSLLVSLLTSLILLKPSVSVVIGLYLLIETLPSLIFVYTDQHINEGVPSEIRASMLSVQSFVSSLFISLAFLGCGFLMETYSSHLVLGGLFVLPLCALPCLMIYFRKAKYANA